MAFRVVGKAQPPQQGSQQPGGLTGIARSIANPFRIGMGQGVEFGFDIGEKLGLGDASNATNPFLNEEEIDRGALTNLTRSGLGIGSFAVPFGKGGSALTRVLAPGFASGALASASEGGGTGDILRSGAVGAGTAGVLSRVLGGGAGSKLGNKLDETGLAMKRGVVNPQVPSTPTMVSRENQITKNMSNLGFKGSARNQLVQMDDLFSKLNKDIEKTLNKDSTRVNLPNLIDDLFSRVKKSGKNFSPSNREYIDTLQLELDKLRRKSDKGFIEPKDIFEFKKQLGKNLQNAFRKERSELGSQLSNTEAAKLDVWGSINDLMLDDAIPVFSEVKPLTKLQSQMFDAAPGLAKRAKSKTQIPFTNIRLSTRPLQAAQSFLGENLQRSGRILGEGSPALIRNDGKRQAATRLGSITAGLSAADMMGGEQTDDITTMSDSIGQASPQAPEFDSLSQATQPTQASSREDQLRDMITLGVISGEISPSQVTALEKLGVLTEEKSPEDLKKEQAAGGVLRLLNEMKQEYYGEEGRGDDLAKGRAGGVGLAAARAAGLAPRAFNYNKLRNGAVGALKDLVGETGVLTDGDILRIKGLLPGANASPEEAERQWNSIEELLGEKIEENVK